MPPGARVAIVCRGGGCPFARRVIRTPTTRLVCKPHHKRCKHKPAPARTNVDLTQLFSGRHLAAHTHLTFTLTKPRTIGAVYALTIRPGAPPSASNACLAPGSSKPGKGC
jgi:hypothetical protein